MPKMSTRDKWAGRYFATRTAVNREIRRLDGMPWLLRITCLASLCTGLGISAASILQIGSFRINEETLTWGQVRAAGYYPFLVVSALAMTVAGIGIWMRRGWSRWLVVLVYVIASPIEIIYWRNHPHGDGAFPWGSCIGAVIWTTFFYWYLFWKQKKAFD
jgi:hypothetical protein